MFLRVLAIVAIVAFAIFIAVNAFLTCKSPVMRGVVIFLAGNCIAGVCMMIMLQGGQSLRALLRAMS